MDTLFLATAVAVFIAVALLIEGLHGLWNSRYGQQAKRIARRLRSISSAADPAPAVSIERKRTFSGNPWLHELLQGFALARRLDILLQQSGLGWSVAQFLAASAAAGLAVPAALAAIGLPFAIVLIAGLAAAAVPAIVAMNRKRSRLARLEQQLPEALELMSRALRAGHALPSAIRMVCDEMPDPLGGEFRIVAGEVQYGVAMREALQNLSTRIPGSDVGFLVVAVLIQRETGGNLAELLDTIAKIIRERLKLHDQVRVYSAEGRLSAWILGLLPFFLGAILHLVNPDFMKTLWTDPAGLRMLGGVLVLMAAGMLWMKKLIRIRV